jgi:large subunit ribosomal protein L25
VGVDTRVTVTVPVVFINHEMSIGLRRGGILNIVRHGVELSCRADSIPEQLLVDLNGLDIGDSVHASAVSFPAGSRATIADRDFTIASIAAPSALREEAAAAAAAPPATAEPLAAS